MAQGDKLLVVLGSHSSRGVSCCCMGEYGSKPASMAFTSWLIEAIEDDGWELQCCSVYVCVCMYAYTLCGGKQYVFFFFFFFFVLEWSGVVMLMGFSRFRNFRAATKA